MKLTEKELLALAEVSETGTNEFEYHVFSDEHLEEFARAVIAENNKKVLADLKPVTLHQIDDAYDAWELCGDDSIEEPKFYSADQVAALIQERDALAAKLQASDSAYAELDSELQQVRQQLFDRT